jgi:hypothetical protein
MISRRSLLGFLATAPLVAAAAPAVAKEYWTLRTHIPIGEVYGASPGTLALNMTATEVKAREVEAFKRCIEAMRGIKPGDIIDCIDWKKVNEEMGAHGNACIFEEEIECR